MKSFSGVIGSLLVLAFASAAEAHPVPFSYLNIEIHANTVDVSLVAHIYDLAQDLQISPMERLLDPAVVSLTDNAIRQLLGPRITLAIDGRTRIPEWSR